jgi:hypothetical protein
MRRYSKLLLLVMFLGTIAWAQQRYRSDDPDLLVRLSYERSPSQQRICISVSEDGDYRIASSGKALPDPIRLKGKMDDDQLLRLKKMLAGSALRSLPPNNPGMIRDHAENFTAEISRIESAPAFKLESTPSGRPRSDPGPPRRLQWLNGDDEAPFPPPIAKLVDWMETFKPKNAKPFDYSEFSDVCPSVGLSFVQPSIAANERR